MPENKENNWTKIKIKNYTGLTTKLQTTQWSFERQ